MTRPDESDEWLEELVTQWTEVHKKSMTTLVLLRIIERSAPANADTIRPDFAAATGWELSERAVYRTLRRLAANGLLSTHEESAPKTGAKRKNYALTDLGLNYLRAIEVRSIDLDR